MHNPADILNNYLKGNYKNSINEEIARYFIVHLADIQNLKLTEVAEKCHVSTPTVIRFCRELGFLDFTDFKKCVQQANIENELERSKRFFFKFQKDLDSYKNRINVVNDKVMSSISLLDLNKIDELAKDIFSYRYVYIFGASLSLLVGEYLRIQLIGLNKNIIALSSPKMDIHLSPVKEDTLGIVLTQQNGYFRQNPEIISYLQHNCSKTWLITQVHPEKSYQKFFNNTLFLKDCEDMLTGYHIMLNVSEILVEYCDRILNKN